MIRTSGFTPKHVPQQEPVREAPVMKPSVPEVEVEKKQEIPEHLQSELLKRTLLKKRKNNLFYFFMVLFLAGMLYGTVFARNATGGLLNSLSAVNQSYLYEKGSQSLMTGFVGALTSSGIFLLIALVSGMSAIGQPVSVALMFVRGLGIGSYTGYLYVQYGGKGVLYSVLLILPGVIISTMTLIVACRESFRLSNVILFSFLKETGKLNKTLFMLYIKKFIILFICLVVSAVADTALSFVFSGLIRLT